jgi:hypothetical protein
VAGGAAVAELPVWANAKVGNKRTTERRVNTILRVIVFSGTGILPSAALTVKQAGESVWRVEERKLPRVAEGEVEGRN